MKITDITFQVRDKNRINISVDGKYKFSLNISQMIDLGIKVGNEYTSDELENLENESQFGKLYSRSLEYCFMRPHSSKEVRDYLYRKTIARRTKTGELRPGVTHELTLRVFDKLVEKGYVNDQDFTRYWVDNRSLSKGASRRKIISELRSKGVEMSIIDEIIENSSRNDEQEIQKIISKKRSRYPDDKKLMAYLSRQGFSYDDIKSALGDTI